MKMNRTMGDRIAIFAVILLGLLASAKARGQTKPALSQLDGTWLADDVENWLNGDIEATWNSKFIVHGRRFTVTHFQGGSNALQGSIDVDPEKPTNVDLHVEPIDLLLSGRVQRFPAATLPALQQIDGNRWIICFSTSSRRQRPTSLHADRPGIYLLKLDRVDPAFEDFPKEVTVFVHDGDGKPV